MLAADKECSHFLFERRFDRCVRVAEGSIGWLAWIGLVDQELLFDARRWTSTHHGDPLPEQYGLAHIMGDVDHGHSELPPELQ
jgi:hypothetical protein